MVKQPKQWHDGAPAIAVVQAVTIPVSGRSRKCERRKRLFRPQVLRMLSQKQAEANSESETGPSGSGAVTPGSFPNGEGSKEFLSTGRTGRRNAMPDILGQHAETGTADLPARLEALTTNVDHGSKALQFGRHV
ncbi:uncharacterized protein LOC117180203 isoform X2 [Belonocnema kinseyi]|uniref:uncharacterized protein LOC117180203 isoform X2 n=1 Tax=Belonocnema kinseyi TaxID=2817044 RepID=UPI00143D4AC1|nr:uncharacterized protein LOC117180203 isoform X2 [Belonocnema kinseyi]XP_033228477.1 uncharacterized protein LOC117180203 isoform X2 [Belonocnema kinseyi]